MNPILNLLTPEGLALLETTCLRQAVDWQGAGFRFASRAFASDVHFVDGRGASLHGGRYTPKGGPATLYLAVDPVTAVEEVMYYHRRFNVSLTEFKPKLLASVAVSVGTCLDFTNAELCSALSLSAADLLEEWEPYLNRNELAPTQALGRQLFEFGIEALLVPSARHDQGENIVVFIDNLASTSHAIMLNPDA